MLKDDIIKSFEGKVIVTCMLPDLMSSEESAVSLAKLVVEGGAGGVIVDGVNDTNDISKAVNVPVIAMNTKRYEGSDSYITPTMAEVSELVEKTRTDLILVDGSFTPHPVGDIGPEFIREIKLKYPETILMADVLSFDEGVKAYEAGADLLITSLSDNKVIVGKPDFELVNLLSRAVSIPVIAAGSIWSIDDARELLENGAYAVSIGRSIVNPYEITKRYARGIEDLSETQK